MKLPIRLHSGKIVEVRAHRILAKQYPQIQLYVHHSFNGNTGKIDTNYFNVSTIDGFSIYPWGWSSVWVTVDEVEAIIITHGVEYLLKRQRGLQKTILSRTITQ